MLTRSLAKLALSTASYMERGWDCITRVAPAADTPVDTDQVRHILIWSMDRLGDLVRATPAIRAIKERFPSAQIAVVAAGRGGPILRQSPWIDPHYQVNNPFKIRDHLNILRQIRQQPWDLGVLMEADPYWASLGSWWFRLARVPRWVGFDFGRGLSRRAIRVPLGTEGSWINQFNRLTAAIGAKAKNLTTELYLSDNERRWADDFLRPHGIEPGTAYFVIHPGGNFLKVSRQWPPEAFAALIRMMKQHWPHPVVLTGLDREQPVIDQIRQEADVPIIDLCGRLDMRQLAAVIGQSAVCIMNDTGPLHVALALGRPTVVILGPTAPQVVGIPDGASVVRADLPCSPCAFFTGWKACANPIKWECLTRVTPDQVLKGVQKQMERIDLSRSIGAP